MPPLAREDPEESEYRENLRLIRERVLGFLIARRHDRAEAEDVTQDCIVTLLDHYPQVRDRIEMLKLATRIAGNKICQVYRGRKRLVPLPDAAASEQSGEKLIETVERREMVDRVLLAMLELGARCRDLLRMLLIEQKDYAEIRAIMGIESDYIYVLRERCFRALKRNAGGSFYGTP